MQGATVHKIPFFSQTLKSVQTGLQNKDEEKIIHHFMQQQQQETKPYFVVILSVFSIRIFGNIYYL